MELAILIVSAVAIWGLIILLPYILKYEKEWEIFNKIPGPPETAYVISGHPNIMSGHPDEMYEKIVKWSEDCVISKGHEIGHIRMGPLPVVFVAGPNAAEVLLRSSKHMEKSFFYNFLHSWLGTGLLTSKGEKWKSRRKLLTPTFHFNILEDFLEVMNEQSRIFITNLEKFDDGEAFNMFSPITLCALDIICETAMGKSVRAQDNGNSEYVTALYRCSELIIDRMRLPPWFWWEFGYRKIQQGKEYYKYLKVLHDFTQSVIRGRVQDLKSEGTFTKKRKRLAFLDLLIKMSEGGKLDFSDIQEEVDTFMFEGHDTTSAAMVWCVHVVGKHADVQRKIQNEIDEVLGDDPTRKITMDDLRKLEYLEMVTKESLRVFPSVPMIGRTTSCDCIIDGHTIPHRTACIILPQVINKNKHFWCDANRFDPERFSTENSDGRHPYAYLPFSAGSRNCIGQRFALMEEKVILAYLLREYSVVSCDATEDLRMMGDLILRPRDGINVKIRKRERI